MLICGVANPDFMPGDNCSRGLFHRRSISNFIVRWNAPPPGVVKLNFDSSLSHKLAAGGFIIGDWIGQLIKARAAHYGESKILIAETRALRDGIKAAANLGINRFLIEGDNATVIRTLRGEVLTQWEIAAIIKDVKKFLSNMTFVSISHVYREANMAADWISKASQTVFNTEVCWDISPPQELRDIMDGFL